MSLDFNGLTSKQKKVYSAIEAFIKLKGIPPTVREIGEMLGEKTPGAVQGILNRLEQKGVIKREIGMARSIQLVSDDSLYIKPVYIPEIKKVSKRNASDLLNIYNINKYHPFSQEIINCSGKDCFLLQYNDNILSETLMKNGDMLVISKDCDLVDGDMVLAVYENNVLFGQYYVNSDPDTICLKSDKGFIDKEIFDKNEITVIGKLIGRYTKITDMSY